MRQYNLLRDADIEPLARGVLQVLEKVGVLCQNREMLEAMARWGASVDYEAETARFPEGMCVELLETVRKESQAGEGAADPSFGTPGLPGFGTQVAQFVYDYGAGERRSGNRRDLVELIKLGTALHPDSSVGHSLLMTDVPPMLEPLEAAMCLAEYAHRPGAAFAWHVRQVDYLMEMGEILGIPDWFGWGAICFAHPLRFDRDVADKFVRRVREGAPTGLTAMPVAGITTPITVPGFIAVAGAEIVATWLAARALNPEVPLGGGIWGGAIDMKTGAVSYCAFDAMRYAFALSEFLEKWTGKFVGVGGGEYCDAKEPGYYAAMEKAYKAMTIAAFTGRHPGIGQGMLEEGKTLCPVQLLLERDLTSGVRLYGHPIEVSPEAMCMESIMDVGLGLKKNYFTTDETLYHFRDYGWCPELMDRSGWAGAKTDATVLERMQEKVDALMGGYKKPDVDPDKLAAMRAVVERARTDLLA